MLRPSTPSAPPAVRAAGLVAATGLLVWAFPLHLLFEIPVGLAGEPTDWGDIGWRSLRVVAAAVLFALVRRPSCPHRERPAVALSARGRAAVAVAAALPVVGWTLPHLAWMANVPLGISAASLAEARTLPVAAQAAVTLAPLAGSVLTLALGRRWAQVLPPWLPAVGGRHVPRGVPLVSATVVGVLVTAYGVIGVAIMAQDLTHGRVTIADLVSSWAVVTTEFVFVLWGVALLLAAPEFARATRCRLCTARS